eukprot:TRINITY_DN1469_c0_g1_i3.p1 TRINITY_DN1469_c0_g1~~TRINITY_DN1469_c0_g1_i3.p1  ORF type:complete len:230 (-),score=42.26 TRINITY_DN1469_c0_g1_i3:18-707(-)
MSINENMQHIPKWMMKTLSLREGDEIEIRMVPPDFLPKGTLVKVKYVEQSQEDLQVISKDDLEKSLSFKYCALTEGQTIQYHQGDEIVSLQVLQCQPAPSIDLVETTLHVEIGGASEQPLQKSDDAKEEKSEKHTLTHQKTKSECKLSIWLPDGRKFDHICELSDPLSEASDAVLIAADDPTKDSTSFSFILDSPRRVILPTPKNSSESLQTLGFRNYERLRIRWIKMK